MSRVKDLTVTLQPGARAADAPLIGLESYDPAFAVEVLQSFREKDADEQREVLEFLIDALNAGRPEGEEIFPKT